MYTDTSSEEIFDGDNATTAFAYTQNTAAEANVKVSILDSDGEPTALTNGTHFDLAGVGGSGGITVTYPKASSPPSPYDVTLTASEKIVIWIEPPSDQQFGPENTDTYAPSVIGQKFDEQMRVIQKVKKDVSRAYHVELGADAPAAGAVGTVSSSRVLLASATGTTVSVLSVESSNWPATYDRVELELIGLLPTTTANELVIEPIDGGTAISTSLASSSTGAQNGSASVGHNASAWQTPTAHTVGNTDGDEVNGSIAFTYFSAGDLSGVGNAAWKLGGAYRTAFMSFWRTGAPTTSWDGFEVTSAATTISGTVRLWGIPKS